MFTSTGGFGGGGGGGLGQGVVFTVVVVVATVGMNQVVATKTGGPAGAAGGGGGGAGGAVIAAWASILRMRACDLYIKPRRLDQRALVCNGGVSWHFVAPDACAQTGRPPSRLFDAGQVDAVNGPLLSPLVHVALEAHQPHPRSARQSEQVFLASQARLAQVMKS